MKLQNLYSIKRNILKLLFSCFFTLGFVVVIHAQDYLPEKPIKETSIYDGASLLSGAEKASLEQKLINYADTTSTQIVVATVTSLEGQNINLYASQWAHKWGIGQADKDNGLLFLVAKEDRKMAIQVGYGLEHLLTDAMSRRIIELVIAPHFKNEDYYLGLDAGTTSMMEILSGEYQNEDISEEGSGFPIILFLIMIIFIMIILIMIILSKANKNSGRGGSYRNSGSGPIILTGGGRTGGFGSGGFGGGGGFGSGGFGGGFGGGGFGGGGASGGW